MITSTLSAAATAAPEPTAAAPAINDDARWQEKTGPFAPLGEWWAVGLSALILLGDTILARSVIQKITGDSDAVSWFLATMFSLGAVMFASGMGIAHRWGKALYARSLFGVWLIFGLALAMLRMFEPLFETKIDAEEAASVQVTDMAFGLLILILYIGAGLKIANSFSKLANPIRIRYRVSTARLAKLNKVLFQRRAERKRLEERLEQQGARVEQLDQELDAARQQMVDYGTVLKELVRVRLAAHLGDPARSSLYREPLRAEPAA